jgi:hypothetical protein
MIILHIVIYSKCLMLNNVKRWKNVLYSIVSIRPVGSFNNGVVFYFYYRNSSIHRCGSDEELTNEWVLCVEKSTLKLFFLFIIIRYQIPSQSQMRSVIIVFSIFTLSFACTMGFTSFASNFWHNLHTNHYVLNIFSAVSCGFKTLMICVGKDHHHRQLTEWSQHIGS